MGIWNMNLSVRLNSWLLSYKSAIVTLEYMKSAENYNIIVEDKAIIKLELQIKKLEREWSKYLEEIESLEKLAKC